MKNIAEVFGKAPRRVRKYKHTVEWPLPNQLIGLEIEAENTKGSVHPDADFLFPHWIRERDGSLRSGNEYILKSPLKGDALAKAIQDIFSGNVVFHRTATGSTHIHMDMFEEGIGQDTLKALVLLMYALEPAIFAITDPGREWCGYTNKLTSAPDEVVSSVLNMSEDDYRDLLDMCDNAYNTGRYYGINLQALRKYGSVEFRYFPTATSEDELTSWVRLVMCFKKAAMEIGGVAGVNRVVSSEEVYDEFLTTYFDTWKADFMREVPHWKARTSVHKALAIASTTAITKAKGIEAFNEDAVWSNKLLVSKFAKKRNKNGNRPGNILWIRNDMTIPSATSFAGGTLMMAADRIHINDGQGHWCRAPFTTNRTNCALTPAMRRTTLAFLRSKSNRWWEEQYVAQRMGIEARLGSLIAQQAIDYLQRATVADEQRERLLAVIAEQQGVPEPTLVERGSLPEQYTISASQTAPTEAIFRVPANRGDYWQTPIFDDNPFAPQPARTMSPDAEAARARIMENNQRLTQQLRSYTTSRQEDLLQSNNDEGNY